MTALLAVLLVLSEAGGRVEGIPAQAPAGGAPDGKQEPPKPPAPAAKEAKPAAQEAKPPATTAQEKQAPAKPLWQDF